MDIINRMTEKIRKEKKRKENKQNKTKQDQLDGILKCHPVTSGNSGEFL